MTVRQVKMIGGFEHIPYRQQEYSDAEMLKRSADFYHFANRRRSVRHFSERPIPREVIENIIRTAGTAPSGANKQPWTFCLVGNPEIKKNIRLAAEKEEYENYKYRMSEEWLEDLKIFGTDWRKPFLEIAPWLIVVFRRLYENEGRETKKNNYYVAESTGLACGMLLMAIHNAGLAALTHTPSPMNFLGKILRRPANERPFLLIPVGFAAEDAYVPKLHRKNLEDICVTYD